ncbi:MAG: ATP-binding protein [Elusimicrobiota bacterium]
MNMFSLLSFFAFIVYLYLGIHALRLDPKAKLNRIFMLLCLSFAVWAFGNVFMFPAPNKEACWLWFRISSFGFCTFAGIVLHFALILTKKGILLKNWWIYSILYLPGIVFLCRSLTGVLLAKDFIQQSYGWHSLLPTESLWFHDFNIYYSSYVITSAILTWQWGRKTKIVREKKQSKIIVIFTIISLILGSLINVVLPGLKIYVLPEIAPVMVLIWAFGIWYAITKYKLMVLTPAVAADDILGTAVDPIILISPDAKILTVNQATLNLLGYKENELIGKPAGILFAEEELLFKGTKWEKLLKEEAVRDYDMIYQTKVGEKIPVSFSGSVMRDKDDELIGIVGIAHDMRETLELQRKEQEFAAAAAAAKAEAEKAAIAKVAGVLAHEMNTPLMGILGFARVIEKSNILEDLTLKENLTTIQELAYRCSGIIKRMISLYKGETKPEIVQLTTQELIPIVDNALSIFVGEFALNNIEVIKTYQPDNSIIRIDKTRISAVFENLISNSIKAIAEVGGDTLGGKLFVSIYPQLHPYGKRVTDLIKEGGKTVVIEFKDTGIGIEKDNLGKILSLFFSLSKSVVSGTGLGLSVCESIVESFGGEILVESEGLNKGATFKVVLPVT